MGKSNQFVITITKTCVIRVSSVRRLLFKEEIISKITVHTPLLKLLDILMLDHASPPNPLS